MMDVSFRLSASLVLFFILLHRCNATITEKIVADAKQRYNANPAEDNPPLLHSSLYKLAHDSTTHDLDQDFLDQFKRKEDPKKKAAAKVSGSAISPFIGEFGFKLTPDRLIGFMMYGYLTITGAYVALLGFRLFRVLMIVMCFQISYYAILFAMVSAEVFDSSEVVSQLILFFSCLLLGFAASVCSSAFEKFNYVVFGSAVGTVITLFVAQFWSELVVTQQKVILMPGYLLICVLCSLVAYFLLNDLLVIGSAFTGAVLVAFNVGVLCGNIDSFESMTTQRPNNITVLLRYLLAAAALFVFSMGVQFYFRGKLMSRFKESVAEAQSRESTATN